MKANKNQKEDIKMRHLDGCYFCTTPYQIIAAISILKQRNETADLYVLNWFEGAQYCVSEIKKENLFSEVKLIEPRLCPSKTRLLIWVWEVFSYLQDRKIAESVLIPDTIYDRIYASGRNTTFKCMYFYLLKKNASMKRINFEDGAGSYLNDRFISYNRRDILVQRILFGRNAIKPIYCQMLFCPNLYYKIHGESNRKIEKIISTFTEQNTIDMFNRIFNFKNSDKINEKIILLDCLKDENFTSQGKDYLVKLYNYIIELFGRDNIIVKRHPRDQSPKDYKTKYYGNKHMPFECICMNTKCDSKVLISVASTAVITPKILLDQEPCVLLLYKLFQPKKAFNKDMDNLYYNCKDLYSRQDKFMIPETKTELDECLNKILEFINE